MGSIIFAHNFCAFWLAILLTRWACGEIAKGNNDVAKDSAVSKDNIIGERKRPGYSQDMAPLTTDLGWIQQTIARHNYYRQHHNVQPLRFNRTLCEISQAYANRMARENLWGHNYNVLSKYQLGENLARYTQIGSKRSVTPFKSVDLWYDEIDAYDFKTGGQKYRRAIGHFTQLVWRTTQEMGVAMAVRREGNKNYVFVVANYYPRGNVVGQNLRNVPPPKNSKRPRPRSEDNSTFIEFKEWSGESKNSASTTQVPSLPLLLYSTPLLYYFGL